MDYNLQVSMLIRVVELVRDCDLQIFTTERNLHRMIS